MRQIYMHQKFVQPRLNLCLKSTYFCRQIYCLANGYHGENLQYLMLAAIHRWRQPLSPSHHFLVRNEDIWTRSFQLLRGIIESLGKKRARIDTGIIKIKGDSGRWYGVQPAHSKQYSNIGR